MMKHRPLDWDAIMSKLRGARAKAANPQPLPTGIALPPTQGTNVRLQNAIATSSSGRDLQEQTRLRSFIERYVIERAAVFRVGRESEDGWRAILDGKRMYTQIAYASQANIKEDI